MADSAPAPTYPGVYLQELPLGPRAIAGVVVKGSCEFELTEALFDKDFPGHYMRRIKSVSMMISCVAGPQTKVEAELTLLRTKVRTKGRTSDAPENLHPDRNLSTSYPSARSRASSSRQQNRGIFELNFGNESHPAFEGEGAISQWSLKLPKRQGFDFATISDVIVRLSYTARDGGAAAKKLALAARRREQRTKPHIGHHRNLSDD